MSLYEKIKKLEEDSRPTLYRALKYWGKKPHNVWRELVRVHTEKGNIVYDPFAGSALTFFECVKIGRKPVIADINPLTLFLVDLYSRDYDTQKILNRFSEIEKLVKNSMVYKKNYVSNCSNCGSEIDIYNFRHSGNDAVVAYSYKCPYCKNVVTQNNDIQEYYGSYNLWKPKKEISGFSSVCESSLKAFGGTNITDIWTNRNIEILSYIYDLIKLSSEDIKTPLMFAFLQTLHLTTKMCALRSEKTNRPLSTSWGRPAFMFLKKSMEQNPLVQFKRSLLEKNGVIKALKSRNEYLPKYTYSTNIRDINDVDGIVLLEDSKKINNFSAQLVITDPPYGSIIQYGELSTIWNVWLENFNEKMYKTNTQEEIIIKKDNNYSKYINDMSEVLNNCSNILSPNGSMVVTFNSNNIRDWESINTAIENSNLSIKLKYKQKNKRTSEANVNSTSELANSDYYFILENKKISKENSKKELIAI